ARAEKRRADRRGRETQREEHEGPAVEMPKAAEPGDGDDPGPQSEVAADLAAPGAVECRQALPQCNARCEKRGEGSRQQRLLEDKIIDERWQRQEPVGRHAAEEEIG